MTNLRRLLKYGIYLPTLPFFFKPFVHLLRKVGWLRDSNTTTVQSQRILVTLPYNSVGDLVLSIRFLEHLHALWPEAVIDVVVGSRMASLFQHIDFVGRVIGFTPSPSSPPLARYRDTFRLLDLVRREDLAGAYDVAIDPRWDSDGYAYLARALVYLTGAKTRIAYSGHVDGIDPSLDLFLTHASEGGRGEHELLRKLRLPLRAGLTNSDVNADAVLQLSASVIALAKCNQMPRDKVFQEAGFLPQERFGILSPAATNPRRIWPLEEVAITVRALHRQYSLRFLVIGTSGDSSLAEQLVAMQPEIMMHAAGKTDIHVLPALLAHAALFIGNDSGPAHLAGILGINTVVISPFPLSCEIEHVNAPARFHPCGPRVRVVQPKYPLPPCDTTCAMEKAHCIRQITAAQVISVCAELLDKGHEQL
jgi:ADP-heptose:LPS heptosyltransferase